MVVYMVKAYYNLGFVDIPRKISKGDIKRLRRERYAERNSKYTPCLTPNAGVSLNIHLFIHSK